MCRPRLYLLLSIVMAILTAMPPALAGYDNRYHEDDRITPMLDATAAGTDLYGVLDSTGDTDGGLSARSVTEYRGDVIYRDGKVWMVLFPGGYATLEGGTVTFHYFTQDYLGNVRAVTNGATGEVEQTIAYYPFDGVIADLGSPHGGQPFRFGGRGAGLTFCWCSGL